MNVRVWFLSYIYIYIPYGSKDQLLNALSGYNWGAICIFLSRGIIHALCVCMVSIYKIYLVGKRC